VKDPFGQVIAALTEEMKPLGDKRFQMRLKKPFPQMLFAFGSRACFMMPERIAKTPATEQIKDTTGSGPFRFRPDLWVSGATAFRQSITGIVKAPYPLFWGVNRV